MKIPVWEWLIPGFLAEVQGESATDLAAGMGMNFSGGVHLLVSV